MNKPPIQLPNGGQHVQLIPLQPDSDIGLVNGIPNPQLTARVDQQAGIIYFDVVAVAARVTNIGGFTPRVVPLKTIGAMPIAEFIKQFEMVEAAQDKPKLLVPA